MKSEDLPDRPKYCYATLTADVRVSPSPTPRLFLHCAGRRRLAVQVRPDLIPPYFWCNTYHAKVQLRTDLTSRLKSSLRLLSLTEMTAAVPGPLSWSAAGLVAAGLNVLVVFSRSARTRPTRICYHPDPKTKFGPLDVGESVQVQGVVRAGLLMATSMSVTAAPLRLGNQSCTRWL